MTSDLPGTGGRIREKIEDFVVEEIPLYEASGAGEHLYLTIQKVGVSTHEAIERIARATGYPAGRIGYAGLKDARSVSRQTLSVQGMPERRVEGLEVPGVTVIEAKRHRNKLKIGHLWGNRFVVRLRGVAEGAEVTARAVLDRLTERGAPNLFGLQRFGARGDGHEVGRAIYNRDADRAVLKLLGDAGDGDDRLSEARRRFDAGDLEGAMGLWPRSFQGERRVLDALIKGRPAEAAIKRIPKGVLKLILSSYQSWLFNRLLLERMPTLGALEVGDLAYLHDRGAVFTVVDPQTEQPRADALEISPSGPMFGRKVTLASGEPGERERAVLEEERLDLEEMSLPGIRLHGERRPFRIPLDAATARPDGEDAIVISFALPKGSYATTVLREVMKVEDPNGS